MALCLFGIDEQRVPKIREMFDEATAYNDDLSSWNTPRVNNMQRVFARASSFNGNIANWDVSNVTNMEKMFYDALAFNGSVSSWDVSKVIAMELMFNNAEAFNQDLCEWGDKFPYSSADDIFSGSGCTFQDTPQLDQQGPFCASSWARF